MLHHPRRLALLALIALLLLPATSTEARLVENRAKNFSFDIPEGWLDDSPKSFWAKQGIVYGAVRALDKLKNGKPAKGVGGELVVAVTPQPRDEKGKKKFADLDALANDAEVQSFLMKRFDEDSAKWPEVEILVSDFDDGFPLRILRAKGQSRNMEGRQSDTLAIMLVSVAQDQLIKLRMYGWMTEYDDEGIKHDLDDIEMSFDVIDKTIKKEKAERPQEEVPDTPEEVEDEANKGDRDVSKVFKNKVFGWKLTKPKGIKSKKFEREKYPNAVAWFEDNTGFGSYQIILYVFKRGGLQADIDVKAWALDKWWATFSKDHPEGDLWTHPFPKGARRYLSLPDFATKRVIFDDPKKRPAEMKASDLVKKKLAQKVKGAKIKKVKANPAYRAVLGARRPRTGNEILIRYAWSSPKAGCALIVGFSRRGHEKWAKPIQELLDSIEMRK